MSTHRFILEPYKGVSTRHICPNCHRQRCFSKYIDTEKQIRFPDYVGRCDHEQKCGYHFTPRDYFEQNPSEKEKFAENSFGSYTPIKEVKPVAISYMDLDIVNQSLRGYSANKLFQFLSAQFGEAETLNLMKRYKVGTSKYWDGATVFWQTDNQSKVRTGKIMLYNSETGKRIKEPYNHVTWVHSVLHKDDYNLKQCFFGEHLLSEDKSRPVALVESEKTAIIASYYLPQFLWIASGGKNGCFNVNSLSVLAGRRVVLFPDLGSEKTAIIASYYLPQFLWIASGGKNGCFNVNSLSVLAGRRVVLFPDLGATDYWQSKISLMKSCGIEVQMFDYLEANATEDERKESYDIADYLLKVKPDEAILQQMIRKNPVLKTLIDTFDLKLISVQQGTPQPKVLPPKKRGFRL